MAGVLSNPSAKTEFAQPRMIADKPQHLLAQANQLVEELRIKTENVNEERERIKKETEILVNERQWLITLARKGSVTTTDIEQQLSAMTMQEINLKSELSVLRQIINLNSLSDWQAKFEEFLTSLQVGVEELRNAAPQSDEERHNLFLLKK
jgi:hypothetical protein